MQAAHQLAQQCMSGSWQSQWRYTMACHTEHTYRSGFFSSHWYIRALVLFRVVSQRHWLCVREVADRGRTRRTARFWRTAACVDCTATISSGTCRAPARCTSRVSLNEESNKRTWAGERKNEREKWTCLLVATYCIGKEGTLLVL